MNFTGTLVDDLDALGGIPVASESELLYGKFVLDLSTEDAVAYINAGVPIVAYVALCDRSWTMEQVVAAWEAGIPADYVESMGASS